MAILASRTKTGISWVSESLALFRQSPRKWLMVALAYIGLFVILPSLPGLQFLALLTVLIWPFAIAVIVKYYRNAEMQKTETLSAVIKSIQPAMNSLISLGLICLLYLFATNFLLGSEADFLTEFSNNKETMSEQELAKMMTQAMSFLFKFLLMLIPLLMATWFSPMLIAFNRYPLMKAIKSSVAGSLQYIVALSASWLLMAAGFVAMTLVVSVIVGALSAIMPAASQTLVSFLTFGCMLLATAVMLAFQYVSYRDIFRAA